MASSCSKNEKLEGCSCETKDNVVCVKYDQTGCSDQWPYKDNAAEQVTALKSFFLDIGVELYDVTFSRYLDENTVVCLACHCITGWRYCAKVKEEDVAFVKQFGFYE